MWKAQGRHPYKSLYSYTHICMHHVCIHVYMYACMHACMSTHVCKYCKFVSLHLGMNWLKDDTYK